MTQTPDHLKEVADAVASALRTARWLTPNGGAFYSAQEHRFALIAQLEWALLALGHPDGDPERLADAEYRSLHFGNSK